MTIYTGTVFDMAAEQFHVIATHLDIPEDERPRLLYPKRAVAVSCPIHRDDGSTAVFQGSASSTISPSDRPRAVRGFPRIWTSARLRRWRSG